MKTGHMVVRIAGAVLGAALAVWAAAPAMAGGISPIGIAIDSGGQVPDFDTGIAGVRLALFGGANKCMYGLSVGVIANGKSRRGGDKDVGGLQIACMLNDADEAKFGVWQLAGFVNVVRGGGGGLMQLAGCCNLTEGPMYGCQVAGLFNAAESDFSGVQIAGVCNVAGGDFAGVQIAAVNVAKANMGGIQIGAINYAKTMRGIQIGAINVVSRDMTGISLGAFNAKESELMPILRVHF